MSHCKFVMGLFASLALYGGTAYGADQSTFMLSDGTNVSITHCRCSGCDSPYQLDRIEFFLTVNGGDRGSSCPRATAPGRLSYCTRQIKASIGFDSRLRRLDPGRTRPRFSSWIRFMVGSPPSTLGALKALYIRRQMADDHGSTQHPMPLVSCNSLMCSTGISPEQLFRVAFLGLHRMVVQRGREQIFPFLTSMTCPPPETGFGWTRLEVERELILVPCQVRPRMRFATLR
jgi:hypothetical protein